MLCWREIEQWILFTAGGGLESVHSRLRHGWFVRRRSLHTFCGKECAQAGLCWLKYLIRFRLRCVLVFVAGAALFRGWRCAIRVGTGAYADSTH